MKSILDFLHLMFTQSDKLISLAQLEQIWNTLVITSSSSVLRKMGYDFLAGLCKTYGNYMNEEPLSQFFESVVCKYPRDIVDEEFTLCFQRLMEYANIKKGE
jgi:hypothetical protein